MGLMDKMMEQASSAAQRAQDAGKAGQAKLNQAQAKRKVDGLFRDLGAAVYAQRRGKPGADPSVVDRLIDQIALLEAQHADDAAGTPGTTGATGAKAGGSEATGAPS